MLYISIDDDDLNLLKLRLNLNTIFLLRYAK